MNLQSLPSELILSITAHIPSTFDLYALCLTSTQLYRVAISALYRANIQHHYNTALQWASIYNLPHLTRNMLAHGARINTIRRPPMKELPASFATRCPSFASDTNATLSGKAQQRNNSTPLIFAAAAGYTEVVRALCEHPNRETNVDWENEGGYSALSAAARGGYTDVMELLVARRAKVERTTTTEFDIIHDATEAECPEGPLRVLVKHGVPVDKRMNHYKDCYGDTPLRAAAKRGRTAAVEALLRLGADLRLSEEKHHTPLFDAVMNDHADLVSLLLDHGGRMMPNARRGWSPLECAAYYGSMEVAKRLLERGADINAPETGKLTPVWWATKSRKTEMVRMLVSKGADTEATWPTETPLRIAMRESRRETAEILIDHGANVDEISDDETPVLWFVATRGCENLVARLLGQGADPNTRRRHRSVLCGAIQEGHTGVVRLLLEYKADVNTMDKTKSAERYKPISALAWAVWSGREEIARLLIDHGANVNTVGWGRQLRPLLTATILEGRHLYTKMLLENGADANPLDGRGNSPLFIAIANDYTEVVRWLLEHGADANERNGQGDSPLRFALWGGLFVREKHWGVAKCLLEHGANVHEEIRGETILSRAMRWGEGMQNLLQEYGGEVT
ncbi:uncharacterized protein LDX57_007534 [Aspergillus melleus]|uniref:uncharacterized protein n=1 Tax=Aspergillus melleus TaxID=138277 RepID=UPI001E8E9011|nr:uncharacterized protein LDX57_007534 [Aspergillus melleus]KAH8429862.1 hypothetical protein LDX57_007534 [Aspergillus melleus]